MNHETYTEISRSVRYGTVLHCPETPSIHIVPSVYIDNIYLELFGVLGVEGTADSKSTLQDNADPDRNNNTNHSNHNIAIVTAMTITMMMIVMRSMMMMVLILVDLISLRDSNLWISK